MSLENRSLVMSLTLIATLGGLLFGYDTAVISGAISSIDANFIDSLPLAATGRSILSGFTVSSALFGCIIGGASAGVIGDRHGRRKGLMLAGLLFLICSAGSAWPEIGFAPMGSMGWRALIPFNVYRILGGVGVGLASLLSPLYIAEIAPARERGRLVTCQQLAIVGGMILVYFVNWAIAAQGDDGYLHHVGWRWMFASEAVPALAFIILLIGVPDSPRWLVMKGLDDQARSVLLRLVDAAEAPRLLAEIKSSLAVDHERLLAYGPLVITVGILLSVFQQLVGINAVLYYAPLMFANMGASTDTALLQTVIVGAANVAFTVVAMLTVDRLGRKPLLIAGAGIMAAAMLALGALFAAHDVGVLALSMVLVYIAGFALSWGPIVWVMLSEIFPNSIKARGMAIAVAVQWLANLAVSWSFKVLDGNAALNAVFNHGFSYLFYGVMSIVAALFVWRYVPETKGRSLEQIQHLWRGRPRQIGAATKPAAASEAGAS